LSTKKPNFINDQGRIQAGGITAFESLPPLNFCPTRKKVTKILYTHFFVTPPPPQKKNTLIPPPNNNPGCTIVNRMWFFFILASNSYFRSRNLISRFRSTDPKQCGKEGLTTRISVAEYFFSI
jgi:hypothetical protein